MCLENRDLFRYEGKTVNVGMFGGTKEFEGVLRVSGFHIEDKHGRKQLVDPTKLAWVTVVQPDDEV